jgi:hypothetical protein
MGDRLLTRRIGHMLVGEGRAGMVCGSWTFWTPDNGTERLIQKERGLDEEGNTYDVKCVYVLDNDVVSLNFLCESACVC